MGKVGFEPTTTCYIRQALYRTELVAQKLPTGLNPLSLGTCHRNGIDSSKEIAQIGFEPMTVGLWDRRSTWLSYWAPKMKKPANFDVQPAEQSRELWFSLYPPPGQ